SYRTRRGLLREFFAWLGLFEKQNRGKHLFLGVNLSRYQERDGLKDPWSDPIIDSIGRSDCIKFYAGAHDCGIDGWSTDLLKSLARITRRFGPKKKARRAAAQLKDLCSRHGVPAPSVSEMAGILLDRWAVWMIYRY